jgi:ribosomal protein S18 acetylase RimI-like enzyme
MDVVVRRARADDVDHVKWGLYTALAWSPVRVIPPVDVTLAHQEAARYHRDWGRAGDLGVLAEHQGEVVGVAYSRLFTEEDHGHGYMDDETPEVAVAVREDWRGQGLGARLMRALAEATFAAGFKRLSLSVDAENPALRLYERLGYREVARDDDGVRMVIDLANRLS